MHFLNTFVKSTIPSYFSNLPVPDSLGGWFRLSPKEFVQLTIPIGATAGLVYLSYLALCPHAQSQAKRQVNNKIRKSEAKVVDTVDIEDISEKAVFCRCWKSSNWPYCDGSHGKHNSETCDNVGPLIVKHKS